MAMVTGIGGFFFKARNPSDLARWYRDTLGVGSPDSGHMHADEGHPAVTFLWRDQIHPDRQGRTVWGPFPEDTSYFAPSEASWMMNFRVDDLDAALAELRAMGVQVDDEVQEYPYGRFGWIMDPEGNRIELWQPPEEAAPE